MESIAQECWNRILVEARTHRAWRPEPVPEELLRRLYELVRLGPTAMNCQPIRLVFVRSPEAKDRLRPVLDPGNVEKTMAAPVTVIVAYDVAFHTRIESLNPAMPRARRVMEEMDPDARDRMGRFSATLQAGYLLLAARGLGLDCGPMGGFDAKALDAAFFPDGRWRSLLLVNLGVGEPSRLHPRAPRLEFDEACAIL
ncbi:malonic semialdehyde reductase [Myxococcota bacterium]|nr:malonic semialdehyde reductase [Myxococcota bacterium]